MTPEGPRRIIDLNVGDMVWSFKDGQIVPRPVEHMWRTSAPDMVYEVLTSRGPVRASGNHPFMVRVPGNSDGANGTRNPSYEWRKVEDLKRGDCVIRAMAYPEQYGESAPDGTQMTPDMMRFLGAVVGDGTVSPGVGVRIAMPPNDRCADVYKEMASALFTKQSVQSGGGVVVQERVPRSGILIQERERQFGFSSAQASRMLDAWGFGGRAHTKRIPAWVYGLRRDLQLALLAGIVDTDGSVDTRGVMSLTFCNRALLDDVRDLATACGLGCSSVSHRTIPAWRLPQPGTSEEYEAWTFVISSAVDVASIPFADPMYRERVNANQHRHRPRGKDAAKAGLSGDLGFFIVRSVTPVGEEWVYDLTVEDGHSFFCEHVLVSNTFSNFAEAREAAYEGNIIPTQRLMAADLTLQLLPDFAGDNPSMSVQFDLTKVRVLQPDMDKLALRMATLYRDGVAMRAEAKLAMALPVSDDDYVYSVSKNLDLLRPDNTTLHSATQPVPAVTEPGDPLTNDPLLPAGTPGTNGHSKQPIPA